MVKCANSAESLQVLPWDPKELEVLKILLNLLGHTPRF